MFIDDNQVAGFVCQNINLKILITKKQIIFFPTRRARPSDFIKRKASKNKHVFHLIKKQFWRVCVAIDDVLIL